MLWGNQLYLSHQISEEQLIIFISYAKFFAKKKQPFSKKIRISFCKHRLLAKITFAKTPLTKAYKAKNCAITSKYK